VIPQKPTWLVKGKLKVVVAAAAAAAVVVV